MSLSLHKIDAPLSVTQVTDLVDEPVLDVIGDPAMMIDSVASLGDDAPGSLVFCKARGLKARGLIEASQASVILVGDDVEIEETGGRCYLRVTDPARWFVRAMRVFFPDPQSQGVDVGPGAVIEPGAVIGHGCRIGAGSFIGASVTLGAGCDIGPNCSLGVAGLAVAQAEDGTPLAYPHLGRVVLGTRVRLGANCVVVRGILETTRIGDDSQLGNMVNVGHNCDVGSKCWISTKALLCGSVTLATGVMVGAGATLNNHVTVGEGAHIGLGSVVTKSVAAGQGVFGVPARPLPTMRKF